MLLTGGERICFNILCGQRKHERYRREGKNSSFLRSQGSRRWKIVVEKVGHADAMSVAEGPCELVLIYDELGR